LNPAVTVAAYIYDMVSLSMAFAYFAAQMLGAFIGYGLLMVLLPKDTLVGGGHGLCVTVPHPSVLPGQAFGIEFVITSILIIVCCGVWDPRKTMKMDYINKDPSSPLIRPPGYWKSWPMPRSHERYVILRGMKKIL